MKPRAVMEKLKEAGWADGLYGTLRGMAEQHQDIPAASDLETVKAKVRAEREGDGLAYPEDTLYQYRAAPALDMVPVRVNITVPRSILDEIDRRATLAGMTRSGFLVAAAQAYTI